MLASRLRRPLPVAIQIAALSLGVSAIVFPSKADERWSAAWVWGVAARDAALADAYAPLVEATGRQQRDQNKVKASAPAPMPAINSVGPLAVSTGAGVLIAILDTGIDLDHLEFDGRISPNGACFGASTCAGSGAFGDDDEGHGTHVAGIAAGADDGFGNTGVAPDATLLPVKILGADGSGSYSGIAQGISYAAAEGAQVINMSLGGPRPNVASDYNAIVNALMDAADTSVIVVAAGNSGNGRLPSYPAALATQPGIAGSMIIAGSLAPTGKISRFSSTPINNPASGCAGPRTARVCYMDVFLVAPGENISSAAPGGGYDTMTGTSMAAPYISGAAALVWSAAPYLTPQQVTAILFTSAIDLGKPGKDPIYGRGLVNPAGAIAPLGSMSVATSGGSTSGFSGSGQVGVSQLSGALGFALRSSHAARDLVFFDSFGRDFRVDLTKSVASSAASLSGALFSDGPALRRTTFLGDGFAASALVGDEDASMIAFAGRDALRLSDVRDVVVTAQFADDSSVTVGYRADAAGRINQLDLAASEAYDGLFMSAAAMNSPYLGFASDASLLAASVGLSDEISVSFGHVSRETDAAAPYTDEILTVEERLTQLRSDQTHLASGEGTSASVSWRLAPWALVGFNVAYTDEGNALFGASEGGALALTAEAATASAGAAMRFNLGGDWVASAAWNAGVSQVVPVTGGLFANVSDLRTAAYGAALAKRGVFGADDAIGFGVSRPLHVVEGQAVFVASTGVTKARGIVYTTETIDLVSATPETDIEFGYTTMLGAATVLQLNAIYQLDLAGVQGDEAVAGLATLRTAW